MGRGSVYISSNKILGPPRDRPSAKTRHRAVGATIIMLQVMLIAHAASITPLPGSLKGALPGLCGPVANGYGRGSRKLGIPTANLPCSLFQAQLEELPCGVYIGWAGVRGSVHKSVCNVGFSPTFAGEENPEKIVEAHIMHTFDEDFYGEPMRLLLMGFIREERKFSGIDELLTTIKGDIETARGALDKSPYDALAAAPWLRTGGDETGSLELFTAEELLAPAAGEASSSSSVAATTTALDGPPPPAGFEWGITF